MWYATQELRSTIRTFLRSPAWPAVAIFTLALGIGAATAMWSVVQAVLLDPLPYAEPERLVRLWETRQGDPGPGNVSPQNFLDWQRSNDVFASLAAFTAGNRTVAGESAAERVRIGRVTADYFEVLGVRALHGRTFRPADGELAGDPIVVLSHGFWQRRFAGSGEALAGTLTVDGIPHAVIGVLPADFVHPTAGPADQPELFLPLRISERHGRGGHWLQGIARLAPGVTLDTARARMSTLARNLARAYPKTNAGRGVLVVPLRDSLVGGVAKALGVLFGAVALLLAVACANVANLLLSRALTRHRELAVRGALGASRGQLLGHLLTESLVLALAAGALGTLLAAWLIDFLVTLAGASLPRGYEIGIDGRVLLFTLGVSALVGVLFTLAPAGLALRTRLAGSLGDDLRAAPRGAAGQRFPRRGSLLVVAQIAMAVALVIGAGLFARTLAHLTGVDPGLEVTRVTAIEVALPGWLYDDRPRIGAFYRELLERVGALPGVDAVGAVNNLPFLGNSCDGFRLDDRPPPLPGQSPCADNQLATPGYFRALGVPLVDGRTLTDSDNDAAPPVVIVNEAFARTFWPGQSALGRRLTYNGVAREIVGVVGDVRRRGLAVEAAPEMFIPHLQEAWDPQMFVTVRTAAEDVEPAVAAVRRTVREMDAAIPVGRVLGLEELVSSTVAGPRFRAILLVFFAILALALAAVGIYAVMAYAVSRRTREIGLRMALGARPENVLRLVLGRGLRLTMAGLVLGVGGALAAARWLESLLFGISALDVQSYGTAVLILGAVALLASLVPALRALRVEPTTALRCE